MAYGLLYGLGKDRLAAKMEVQPEIAAQLSAEFRASIPELASPLHMLHASQLHTTERSANSDKLICAVLFC